MNQFEQFLKLPNLLDFNNVLFVGPHPDDIEYGAGGLIIKLRELKKNVHFLICTDGSCGTKDKTVKPEDLAAIRKQESLDGAKLLDVESVRFLGYRDGGNYSVDSLKVDIAKVILELRPDLIVSPDPALSTETHPDHINVANAVHSALFIANYPNNAVSYGINIDSIDDFSFEATIAYYYTERANCLIGLTAADVKKTNESIYCHKSQLDPSALLLIQYMDARKKMLGESINAEFAEDYFVLAPLFQHCFQDIKLIK